MSERAVSNVTPKEELTECAFSVPWSVRNDAIWIAEHVRRRHLLQREDDLAECVSGLCVLMMGLQWAFRSSTRVYPNIHPDERSRDTSRDFRRLLVVPGCFQVSAAEVLRHFPWYSMDVAGERIFGMIMRAAVGVLHRACEEGSSDTIATMHRAIERDPLWGAALRENRARDAVC